MAESTNANFRDTPEFKRQIEHLAKLITKGQTGKGKFVVLGVEAGVGKSIETDRIIADYFNNTDPDRWNRKFLIVKRFVEDADRSADDINSSGWNRMIAVSISHDNWKKYQEDLALLQTYPVIIITHSRYSRLCQNPQLRQVLRKTVKELGIEKQITPHVLRHAFASNLIERGVDLFRVQKLLGHENIKTTSIYLHTNMEELEKAVNLL